MNDGVHLPRQCGTATMCDKCKLIDTQIERYRFLSERISDPQTLEGLKRLTEELKAQKKSLHPED